MPLDRSTIIQQDPGQVGLSLRLLADQLRDGWRQIRTWRLPASYRSVNRVAICGMGGSHLGADIIRSVAADILPGPVVILADYTLPAWVDQKTLVICSSYSGNTEETLSAFQAAIKRRAKIAVVTSGGRLARLATARHKPLWRFTPAANPSSQPRLGIGYNLVAILTCLRQIGWLKIQPKEQASMEQAARQAVHRYGPSRGFQSNPAKLLARQWQNRIPLLFGAEWMAGNLHTFVNQIHENAKTYAAWYLLPDLNHHLLEGLRHRRITSQFHVLFIRDTKLHPRNNRRYNLTARLVRQLGSAAAVFRPHGQTRWAQAIDLLAFGGYVSWYLAAVRGVNPASIPTVDALKRALART